MSTSQCDLLVCNYLSMSHIQMLIKGAPTGVCVMLVLIKNFNIMSVKYPMGVLSAEI